MMMLPAIVGVISGFAIFSVGRWMGYRSCMRSLARDWSQGVKPHSIWFPPDEYRKIVSAASARGVPYHEYVARLLP